MDVYTCTMFLVIIWKGHYWKTKLWQKM